MELRNNEEITGTLTGFRYDELGLILTLTIQKEIRVPYGCISEGKLNRLKGKRIGIAHIDGRYHFRQIKDKGEKWYDKYQ
jgi:hypothetical protein